MLFRSREQSLQAKRQELREAVRIGTEQADRGEKMDGETVMDGFRQKLEHQNLDEFFTNEERP